MRFFFLSVIAFTIASCAEDSSQPFEKKSNRLPFIGHVDIIDIEEDGVKKKDTLFETIAYFDFLNEDSVLVTNETYENKVWVAEFFFASCPTICPTMTINMRYIQNKLKIYPNIKFLSHTVNPEYDSPRVLKKYAQKMRIDESNFNFVTGDKDEIYEIAKSYFVNVSEDELAPGGFLHSEFLVIVDKEGRVRSGYSNFICNTCQATSKKYTLTCPSTGEKNTMKGNVLGSYDGTKDFVIKDMIKDTIQISVKI